MSRQKLKVNVSQLNLQGIVLEDWKQETKIYTTIETIYAMIYCNIL